MDDVAEAGPGEVKSIAAAALGGGVGPVALAGADGEVGVVIEGDVPGGVGEHEEVMVGEIHQVEEFLAFGADAEAGVAGGVAGGGFDLDAAAEEGAAGGGGLEDFG